MVVTQQSDIDNLLYYRLLIMVELMRFEPTTF